MKPIQNHIKATPILDLYTDQEDDFLAELDQRVSRSNDEHRPDAIRDWVN